MAEATFEYQLGEHTGRTYLLTARAVPGFDDPAEFAVIVHYNDPDRAETEQVARIDTATIGSASVLRAERAAGLFYRRFSSWVPAASGVSEETRRRKKVGLTVMPPNGCV